MNTRSAQGRLLVAGVSVALSVVLATPVMAGGASPSGLAARGGSTGVVPESVLEYRDHFDAPPLNPDVNVLADDSFPGDGMYLRSDSAAPAVFDALNIAGDSTDIFHFYAAPGEDIMLFVVPGMGLGVGMELYRGPIAMPSIVNPDLMSGGVLEGDIGWINYTVPESHAPGFYYIKVTAESGSGDYQLWWSINSKSDGNMPGVLIPASPFGGSVDTFSDRDDVYAINLGAGQTLDVTVTGDGTDVVEVLLWESDTLDARDASIPAEDEVGNVASFSFAPGLGEEGVYYLDICAAEESNVGYMVDWSVSGVNIPGNPIPSAPIGGILGASPLVYYVDLTYGQRIDIDIGGAADAELFGPNEVDIESGTPMSGLSYTVPSNGVGRYYVSLTSALPGESFTFSHTINDATERISGSDRYETSAKISQTSFPDGADVVVVATGATFPDALAASGLAGVFDAPVLLTNPGMLMSTTAAEISRLGATRCYIVGGTGAVGSGVAAAIDSLPGMNIPVRVSGSDRYSTAVAVAETVLRRHGYRLISVALMARGDDYADALSLAPIAWTDGFPILLTEPTSLPAATKSFLTDLPIDSVGIGGGPGAISDTVLGAVGDIPSIVTAERLAYGADRYETGALLAEWSSATSPWLSWAHSGVATGENFPDALSGGSGIAKSGGVMVLTGSSSLNSNARAMLTTYAAEIETAELFGGTSALSSSVMTSVKGIVQ